MPGVLDQAVAELEQGRLASEDFGKRVVTHYLKASRREQVAYDHAVTCWERNHYLEWI